MRRRSGVGAFIAIIFLALYSINFLFFTEKTNGVVTGIAQTNCRVSKHNHHGKKLYIKYNAGGKEYNSKSGCGSYHYNVGDTVVVRYSTFDNGMINMIGEFNGEIVFVFVIVFALVVFAGARSFNRRYDY